MPTPLRHDHPSGFKLDRLAGFSDGVISIAITILVLGLEVPSVHRVPTSELVGYLRDAIDPAIGFVVSFVLIGTYWIGHYSIFHYLTHATRPLIAFNGFFLLSLSFLPFPTGLQAAYRNDELAMAFYGAANLICGLTLLAIWLYAAGNHRLIAPTISPVVVRSMTRQLMVAPLVSLLAIGCSFISITLSRAVFILIPISYMSHRIIDSGWQAAETDVARKSS